tara:strand:- start:1539 stop:2789 length:1251 start_codon:yes stop_codon:yes gene_type:complete
MKKILINFLILSLYSLADGEAGSLSLDKEIIEDRKILFPNTKEYLVIISDLHTHSIFSDGHVWPNIRVEEALRDGLDVLAITEHLEYQPHIEFLPNKNRNDAYKEALQANKNNEDLLVINGAEITRIPPAGHMNAIFIQDANLLFNDDESNIPLAQKLLKQYPEAASWEENKTIRDYYALTSVWPVEKAVDAAQAQGAFIFWNHSWWTPQSPQGISVLTDFHKKLIQENKLHGIEIANGINYSDEAFQIAIDNDLTIIGTSDVHNLIDWDYSFYKGKHRPVTLILSKGKTENSIKEALFEGRTVVWFKNNLIGLEKNLVPLLKSSISMKSLGYQVGTSILEIEIENKSDANMLIKNLSKFTLTQNTNFFEVDRHSKRIIELKTIDLLKELELLFSIENAFIAPNENAHVNFFIKTE